MKDKKINKKEKDSKIDKMRNRNKIKNKEAIGRIIMIKDKK